MIEENEIDYNTFILNIPSEYVSINKNNITQILGYNTLPEHIEEIFNEVNTEIRKKININAGYKIFDDFDSSFKEGISISNIFFYTNKIVKSQLDNIDKISAFVVTIGSEIEKWIKQLNERGELLQSYIVDIIASEAVENVADVLHDFLRQKMNQLGLNITNRYSPGYCNWNVSEQHKLFSILPKNFCGIRLTESALMIPIKSISGIIGIGKNAKWREYMCNRCDVKDCTYRTKVMLRRKKINTA
ncbi:MAG: hypothetical protein N2249_07335 [Melioribacter sp.]|nr:hypothetical protein [Melioribacter sp.]